MTDTYLERLIVKERRNRRIRSMRLRGKTYAEIAARFDISIARAHKIATRNGEAKRANKA